MDRLAVGLRPSGGIPDLDFLVGSNRAHRQPEHALERLGRRFLAIAGAAHLRSVLS